MLNMYRPFSQPAPTIENTICIAFALHLEMADRIMVKSKAHKQYAILWKGSEDRRLLYPQGFVTNQPSTGIGGQ